MREYETVFVLNPGLEDSRVEEEIEGVRSTIAAASGEVIDVERWGRRKLAYTIGKVNEGIYTLVRFRSDANAISELERRYRLREDILRHLTVLSQGPPPSEMAHRRDDAGVHAGEPTLASPASTTEEAGATMPGYAPVPATESADSADADSSAKDDPEVS